MTDGETFAVVGVSANPAKFGWRIFADLTRSGRRVYGIGRGAAGADGTKLYASLAGLPLVPDTVIVVVPPAQAVEIVRQCAALGVKQVWLQPGSESDEAMAAGKGMKVFCACYMVRNGIW